MIKYDLICKDEHEFEAWFRDSAAYDEQVAKKKVVCPHCGSKKVTKAIMAPRVSSSTKAKGKKQMVAGHHAKLAKMVEEFRSHVEKTHDYVGDKFPEEARKMHYGETEHRDIYGEASLDDAKELIDEGVPVAPIPGTNKRKAN